MKTKTKKAKVQEIILTPEDLGIDTNTPITDSTRKEIGEKINFGLDLLFDPRFKDDNFRQTIEHDPRSYNVAACNDEVFISFRIEWKGGTK